MQPHPSSSSRRLVSAAGGPARASTASGGSSSPRGRILRRIWGLLPSSLLLATLRRARGPVMTTIDPLLALLPGGWDDQIWLPAQVMAPLPGPLRLSPSFRFVGRSRELALLR